MSEVNTRIFNEKIELPECKRCDGSMWLKNDTGEIISRCSCYLPHKYLDSNIGFDYWTIEPENFQGEEQDLLQITKYFDKIRELKSSGRGFYIYGPNNGAGKTSLVCILLKHVLQTTNQSCLFVPFSELVILNTRLINGSFDKALEEKIEVIKNVQWLVLDDVAKEYDNQKDSSRATLNSILRYRDLWHLPVLYTSNVPIDNLASLYGKANHSIIYGRSNYLVMKNTEDYRRTRKIKQIIKEKGN